MRIASAPSLWSVILSLLIALAAIPATAQTSPTTNYATAGTWSYTVPAGVYFVSVRAAGAGGGGGGSDASGGGGGGSGNGGGGSGGTGAAITVVLRVTPGQILSGVVGGGGGSGFTGGYPIQCVGGGLASAFGGGGNGAVANCASSGYSGGGGAGGGASTVALAGTIVAQAGGGGGGSGGGWITAGANGIDAPTTISQSAGCSTAGSGAAGIVFNLDGGAAGGGGGGFPGGTSGAGSADYGGTAATGGGLQRGGGGGGSCYSTAGAIVSASASGTGGAGAPGINVLTNTSTGAVGADGSVTVTLLPSVIISKISTGGVGDFVFTGSNGVASQTLTTVTAGTEVSGTPQLLTSVTESTVITESAASGFSLVNISCTNLGSGGTATVNLATRSVTLNGAAVAPGVAVICSFNNAAALTIIKGSTPVWDPVNGTSNPKPIPGAQLRYCLQVINDSASPAATSTTVTDILPSGVTFVAGSLFVNGTATGGICNSGALTALGHTTIATGSGASGVAGGSFSGGTVTASLGTINPGATVTVYFDALIP